MEIQHPLGKKDLYYRLRSRSSRRPLGITTVSNTSSPLASTTFWTSRPLEALLLPFDLKESLHLSRDGCVALTLLVKTLT